MLLAALLPPALLWLYIWKKDPQKEPTRWLVKATLWGVAICVPVAIVELAIQGILFGGGDIEFTNLFQSTANAFLVAAIPEEGAKLLVLWLLLRKNKVFDEHFDGIVYAVFISLGFAAIENVAYVFMAGENWLSTAVMRALLAVPGHYAFAILMGYYYSLYHFVDRSKRNACLMFLMPVLAHGVYDSIAMSGSVNPIAGSISFVVLIYFCIKLQRAAQAKIQDLCTRN
jgi:RsiW-degrading membrane proteinase PrsW (M82 family)